MYTKEQDSIALFAKVLGHPARVAILQRLFEINACYCGDLAKEIGLAQSTISQHLKELKNIGIIRGNIEGPSICYCIHEENWKEIKQMMIDFLNQDFILENECC